jgi:uncharacterized protein (TIGR00369 family)
MEEPPAHDRAARRASASRSTLAIITDPGQANPFGSIHGGVILRLADECGALAAFRHSGGPVVTTAAIDGFTFLGPVRVGERVELVSEVTFVGRTSMEARIDVYAESMTRRAGPPRSRLSSRRPKPTNFATSRPEPARRPGSPVARPSGAADKPGRSSETRTERTTENRDGFRISRELPGIPGRFDSPVLLSVLCGSFCQ